MGFGWCCDDINEVFEESQKMLNSPYGTNDNSFDNLLNNCSLEEIDKKIFDYEKKQRKILGLSSTNEVQRLKIKAALSYLKVELDKLEKVKEFKLYRENQNKKVQKKIEDIQKNIEKAQKNIVKMNAINKILDEKIEYLNYLRQLFPSNYFLPSKEEKKEKNKINDDFIPSNWGKLPINVLGKYDDGNDLWIDDDIEWEKAFHGTGRHCKNDDEIKEMIDSIVTNGFKNGTRNVHENCDDILHPGKKIGKGVYVTPEIDIARAYSGTIVINKKQYHTLFLVKVRKNCIKKCNCKKASDYWVVKGTNYEIRPVSVLLSEK